MKAKLTILIMTGVMLLVCSPLIAAENFDDPGWSSNISSGEVVFDPAGTMLYISASDSAEDGAWAKYQKSFDGSAGAVATVNISSTAGKGGRIGLQKYVATTSSGNMLQAVVSVKFYNENYYIRYEIKEKDASYSTVRVVEEGFLGDNKDMWTDGEDVVVAFWHSGSKVCFFTDKVADAIVEVELFDTLSATPDNAFQVLADTDDDGSLSATVSSLEIGNTDPAMYDLTGVDQSFTAYIPHITTGYADWTDYLQVDNTGAESADYTVVLYSNGSEVYNQSHTLGASSEEIIDIKTDLEITAELGVITYSNRNLNFRLSYENSNGGVAEFRLTDDLSTSLGYFFSNFASAVTFKGIALSNFSDAAAEVTLEAVGNGTVQGTYSVTVDPYDKIIDSHASFFPSVTLSQCKKITALSSSSSLAGVTIATNPDISFILYTKAASIE